MRVNDDIFHTLPVPIPWRQSQHARLPHILVLGVFGWSYIVLVWKWLMTFLLALFNLF